MSQTFTSPFTGTVVQPTDVSYYELTFATDQDLFWPAVVNPTQVPAARIIDCFPTVASLHVNLPAGGQGSVGSDILFRNFGAVEFSIVDFSGASSVLIQPGESKYFYLSDNSTENGVWQNVTFGTGTSAADAATLQGAGLTTINGKLAVTGNIVQVSSPPTLLDSSRAATFVWTGGNGTFTLPTAISLTGGWFIGFRNGGSGTLTLTGQGSSVINGSASIGVNPGDSGYLIFQQSTGNFFTVGLSVPSNVTFTSATYDVDAIAGTTLSLVSYAPIIQTYVGLSATRAVDLDVTLPAITQLYVLLNNTGTNAYNVTFQVSGSVQPPIPITDGQSALVLSDGNVLYVLTQTTAGIYLANNGSVSSPSFSFISDNTTGMYLVGTSILGLTANSTQMLNIDASNLLDLQISTPATFTAALISGGTF
jgi:hypothetical protein